MVVVQWGRGYWSFCMCCVTNVIVLQLQDKVKDVHMSEIIDVYEQKLSALAVSGQHIQELPVKV